MDKVLRHFAVFGYFFGTFHFSGFSSETAKISIISRFSKILASPFKYLNISPAPERDGNEIVRLLMGTFLCMSVLFLAKVLDNALGTARTIFVQLNKPLLAGLALAVSNFI